MLINMLIKKQNFKNKIFYLKNNTKQEFISKFKDTMLVEESGQIHIKDMFFLWKIFKTKNLPNMIYKAEFENILKIQ